MPDEQIFSYLSAFYVFAVPKDLQDPFFCKVLPTAAVGQWGCMGWVPFGTRLNLETQKLVPNKLVCPWFSYQSRSYLKRCNLQRHAQLLRSASAAREAAPTPLYSWLLGSPFFMAIRGLDLYSAMACHGKVGSFGSSAM